MLFAQRLQSLLDARGLTTSHAAGKATGVPPASIERYLASTGYPEWRSMWKMATGLSLSPRETVSFWEDMMRDRALDDLAQSAIYLFLSIADDEHRAAISALILELTGKTVEVAFLTPTLVSIAEGRGRDNQAYRDVLLPHLVASSTLTTRPLQVRLAAAGVLAEALGAAADHGDSPVRPEDGHDSEYS